MSAYVPFNRPHATAAEFDYMRAAIANGHLAGGGPFARRCEEWLEREIGAERALLTHSGTAALELAAILAELEPGDEVVMPSFSFVSTANAFALRGAVPVFADISPDTLNLDPEQVEAAIGPRTRAIVPVHYAGVGADLDQIGAIARRHDVLMIEDAAHALPASRAGVPLGGSGAFAALSFHETKNLTCGEGGALLVNDPALVERAERAHDKGTDRAAFFRGEVTAYSWTALGSSFAPSELEAAFLWAHLERAQAITSERLGIWERYHERFEALEAEGFARRPVVPADCSHNAHIYYLLLPEPAQRDPLLEQLERRGVNAVFHYVPLHSSPAGRRLGRSVGELSVTDRTAASLVRLPLWCGMQEQQVEQVVDAVEETLMGGRSPATAT